MKVKKLLVSLLLVLLVTFSSITAVSALEDDPNPSRTLSVDMPIEDLEYTCSTN